MTRDVDRLNRCLDRFERRLPRWIAAPLHWLRAPSSRWVRIPVGLLLIAAGLFSFLPLLGLWMLPLGLLLLTQDLPFLRRPMRWVLMRLERWWLRWRRKHRANT